MPFRSVRDSSYFPLNFDYAGRYLRAILRLGLHMGASFYESRILSNEIYSVHVKVVLLTLDNNFCSAFPAMF